MCVSVKISLVCSLLEHPIVVTTRIGKPKNAQRMLVKWFVITKEAAEIVLGKEYQRTQKMEARASKTPVKFKQEKVDLSGNPKASSNSDLGAWISI